MPTFQSNPVDPSPLARTIKRNPLLFGVPFCLIIVGASFGLQTFTQTRYDLQDQKVKQVQAMIHSVIFLIVPEISNEQALGLDRARKKVDIREEYFVRVHRVIIYTGPHHSFRDSVL